MVRLPKGYCIDSTEVTRAQYEQWLASNPALPPRADQLCGWKATGSYAADSECMKGGRVCQSGCASHPQPCVDWCDGYAYCQSVGKRLCGKIEGGSNGYFQDSDADSSQWYNACASGGLNTYAYGNTYNGASCNGGDNWFSTFGVLPTTFAVKTMTTCQSPNTGYAGIFDLSGNVSEWEDSCEDVDGTGSLSDCRVRGGGFDGMGNITTRCDAGGGIYYRTYVYDAVGFRCCSQ